MANTSKRQLAAVLSVILLMATIGCTPAETPAQKEVAALMAKAKAEAEKLKPTKPKDRSLLEKMKVKKDEMRDLTFYHHTAPYNIVTTDIHLYIVESKDGLALRMYAMYFADSWLFVHKAWTKLDGIPVDLPTVGKWNHGNSSGSIWEYSDSNLDTGAIAIMKKFSNTPLPTVRFEGDKSYEDFKPSGGRLAAMRDVIAAYEAAMGIEIK